MKRIFLLATLLIFFIFRTSVHADEGWIIDNFHSNIEIQNTGEVFVSEKIDVDFDSLSKHGIYRDIPYVYDSNGSNSYSEIDVLTVLQNNTNAKYNLDKDQNQIRIKIGDSQKEISGKNTYVINYKVKGILRGFSDHDELYWNVTGNNWPVAIKKASASVTLPKDGILRVNCYEGYYGSTETCISNVLSPTNATFETKNVLDPQEGLTIVVGYQKNLVPILTVSKPQTLWDKFWSLPSELTLISVVLFGVLTVFILWYKYGRDYWFSQKNAFDPNAKKELKPLGANETIVVEFTPPDGFTPAELGILMDERADTLDVVATIIDLATRGYITIKEESKKWLFGKKDYMLTKKEKDAADLRDYEKNLLNKIFKEADVVMLSHLKTTFYEELREIKQELYKHVVSKNLFPSNPDSVRLKYLSTGFVILAIGIAITIFSAQSEWILIFDVGIGIFVSGLLLIIMSRFMSKRTAHGRELYRRTKGFQLFISQAEKYRQQFFEKENMFNKVLPYAIMFGLTEKFANAMKDIGIHPQTSSWYIGSHPFTVNGFTSGMNSFSNSMSSAIAASQKGSGFSSGGGGSGGGFGGGGGGSW